MKRIKLSQIASKARTRPEGYVEYVLSLGKIVGDFLELEDHVFNEIRKKYREETPKDPKPEEMVRNFSLAMGKWIKAGFKVVDQEKHNARAAICQGNELTPKCDFWEPGARLGMGKCKKCGCTKMKLWLATEKCPVDKW